jgi:hypothetical protein
VKTLRNRFLIIGCLGLGILSVIGTAPAALRIAGGLIMSFYLPGFLFFYFLGDSRRPALDNLFLPLLVSPILVALLLYALFLITGSLHSSTELIVLIVAIITVVSLILRRPIHSDDAAPVPRTILIMCLAYGGLLLFAYLSNRFLLIRSDAWYHLSVANEVINRGIPLHDPWYANEPIRYMWIYHLFIAGFVNLSGLPLPIAMGIFNAINAFIFPYLVARLTALFRREPRYVLGTPLFAISGIQSVSWIFWPTVLVRAFFGEVKGWAEVSRIVQDINLNGNRVIWFLTPFGTLMVNLVDKFFVITAFNYTLNLFLLCFVLILSAEINVKSVARMAVSAFFVMLGAFLFHIIIGTILILTVIGSGMLLAAVWLLRSRKREWPSLVHSLIVPVTAALAGAAGLPYLMSLASDPQTGNSIRDNLHIGFKSMLTIAIPLAVLYMPFRAAVRKMLAFENNRYRIFAAWLVTLVVLCVVVNIPAGNESKIIFPLFLLLTPLIAWEIIDAIHGSRGIRRLAIVLGIGIVFCFVPIMTVRGFFLEKPMIPREVRRAATSPGEREIFAWIAGHTPLDAVIMEGNDYAWMPVYAKRRDFFALQSDVDLLGYNDEETDRSSRIQDNFFSDAPVAKEDIDFLRSRQLKVFVVVWREDSERIPQLAAKFSNAPDWFREVYENSAGTIYEVLDQR